jgi:hypothetical protein
MEGLFAKRIACSEESLAVAVPQGKSVHAFQATAQLSLALRSHDDGPVAAIGGSDWGREH